ncbi:MAG: glycosyl hydrolase 53 family protein [Bacteroidota bacterium]
MKSTYIAFLLGLIIYPGCQLCGQDFWFGADQSYVNEMEDCGAVFKENGEPKDVYRIYADHGNNLVRLRLWHTPSWYDGLNSGQRYSDLEDVKKSIRRAKEQNMDVLLDFHLSDNWADPSKQVIPSAWVAVVDNLPVLQDSVYNYVSSTLNTLKAEGLLPELVQVGNETNRGILLSPEQNQTWTLDWKRNAPLFNSAIQAVRDVSADIEIALHLADPDEVEWWVDEFVSNGVTDFDIIAMSYYWAWHQPTTVPETGEVIMRLNTLYPGKKVIVVETGYIWTTNSQDQANNIINSVHPSYSPASPTAQKQWLIDLTQEVMDKGGDGVVYWEPSWVSTPCSTQWGKGSHQEHATFFDFNQDLLIPGGIEWMEFPYVFTTSLDDKIWEGLNPFYDQQGQALIIEKQANISSYSYTITDLQGALIQKDTLSVSREVLNWNERPEGIYVVMVDDMKGNKGVKKFFHKR